MVTYMYIKDGGEFSDCLVCTSYNNFLGVGGGTS